MAVATRDIGVSRHDYRRAKAEKSRRNLAYFMRQHWQGIPDHSEPMVWPRFPRPDGGFFEYGYLDILCAELEAVTRGATRLLVITIPPGHAKSLSVSVFWPSWEWLTDPTLTGHYLSGNDKVRIRDAMRTRDLIQSDCYQETRRLLGQDWTLDPKHNQKANFRNTEGGQRYTDVVDGKVTGSRADKQVVDDPNDVDEVEKGSPSRIRERMESTVNTWDAKLSDRLNDEHHDPRVLIQQRLHESDLAGVLQQRDDYRVVSFQTEYDPDYAFNHPDDPRTEPGQLLFPERFPASLIEQKRETDPLYDAKMNQDPQPDTGGIIDKAWTQRRYGSVDALTPGTFYQSWDFRNGGESKDTSYAVGQLWLQPDRQPGRLALVDQFRGRWDVTESLWLYLVCNIPDLSSVQRRMPMNFSDDIDADLRQMVKAHPMYLWRRASMTLAEREADGRTILPLCDGIFSGQDDVDPDGSKAERLARTSPYWRSGDILLIDQPWVDNVYVPEITGMPNASHDDQADATSQIINEILGPDDDDGEKSFAMRSGLYGN